jgi:hypothetical protein
MKGLDESFHLQYQRLATDNQSKIRYTIRYTQSVLFSKKNGNICFFFFSEYWQLALDAASKSRQSGDSFAATDYVVTRRILFKNILLWAMPAFVDFAFANCVTRCSMPTASR